MTVIGLMRVSWNVFLIFLISVSDMKILSFRRSLNPRFTLLCLFQVQKKNSIKKFIFPFLLKGGQSIKSLEEAVEGLSTFSWPTFSSLPSLPREISFKNGNRWLLRDLRVIKLQTTDICIKGCVYQSFTFHIKVTWQNQYVKNMSDIWIHKEPWKLFFFFLEMLVHKK